MDAESSNYSFSTVNLVTISELKSLIDPPVFIVEIVKATCLIIGVDESWKSFLKVADDTKKFVENLNSINKAAFTLEKYQKLSKYMLNIDGKLCLAFSKHTLFLFKWQGIIFNINAFN